jgi:5-methylcytosine-specific restriction endonuclease McrA
MISKSCSRCKEIKSLDSFHADNSRKDGLQPYCKSCRKIAQQKHYVENKEQFNEKQAIHRLRNKDEINRYSRNRYEKNKEKESERKKKYYQKNKEMIDARNKKYNEQNKEKRQSRAQIYYQQNKDRIKLVSNAYRFNNPELNRNASAKRRAIKESNGIFVISKKELKALYESDCFYCGSKGKIELDHVLPIIKGGRHSIGNLVAACQSCNRSKGAKLLVEWINK